MSPQSDSNVVDAGPGFGFTAQGFPLVPRLSGSAASGSPGSRSSNAGRRRTYGQRLTNVGLTYRSGRSNVHGERKRRQSGNVQGGPSGWGIQFKDKDRSLFDEKIQCIIDMRDAFQREEIVGCANDAGGSNWFNVKFVSLVGDIVEQSVSSCHGETLICTTIPNPTAMQIKADFMKRFTDPLFSAIDIAWSAVPGNHDDEHTNVFGQPAAPNSDKLDGYIAEFGGTAQESDRAFNQISVDGDVSPPNRYVSSEGAASAQRLKPLDKWPQTC